MKLQVVFIVVNLAISRAEELLNGRIVGGQDADITDFPYQVSVQIGGIHFCGGSIIRENWVISAAHCFGTGYKPIKILSVRVGSSFKNKAGNIVKVEQVYVHPEFDPLLLLFDVALIKTKTIQIGDNVKAISLPDRNMRLESGKRALVTGWGYLLENAHHGSENLQYIKISIADQEKCKNYFFNKKWNNVYSNIGKTMFCAIADKKDACKGDSGGPIVVEGKIVGVVSFGTGCGAPNSFGVYTHLANPDIRKWIKDLTQI